MADNNSCRLYYYVEGEQAISDFKRIVRLVVQPDGPDLTIPGGVDMILGVPWLYSVDARIDARTGGQRQGSRPTGAPWSGRRRGGKISKSGW